MNVGSVMGPEEMGWNMMYCTYSYSTASRENGTIKRTVCSYDMWCSKEMGLAKGERLAKAKGERLAKAKEYSERVGVAIRYWVSRRERWLHGIESVVYQR